MKGRDVDLHPAKLDAGSPGGCWCPASAGIVTEEQLGVQPSKGGHGANLPAQLLLGRGREQQRLCQAQIRAVTSSLPQGQHWRQQPLAAPHTLPESEAGIKKLDFPLFRSLRPSTGPGEEQGGSHAA